MKATAYYNEIDKKAAAWLRELIRRNQIAPGVVDERSIEDVEAKDLVGFTQCHFFAGIGGWSLALRLAGWPDDRSIWTGSCPCPPFSSAGKKKRCPACGGKPVCHAYRSGFFRCLDCGKDWLADQRHLWPEFHRLIRVGRPDRVLGEQVANGDGLAWLDIVSATLEIEDYAVGSVTFPACGVGAPHIRQRLYWLADAHGGHACAEGIQRSGEHRQRPEDAGAVRVDNADRARCDRPVENAEGEAWGETRMRLPDSGCAAHGLDNGISDGRGTGRENNGENERVESCPDGTSCRMADHCRAGLEGHAGHGDDGHESGRKRTQAARHAPEGGGTGGLADALCDGAGEESRKSREGTGPITGGARRGEGPESCDGGARNDPGPLDGVWRDADWLFCRDGKWRPVESGTFPLAHGLPARVGRLRGYGNAIVIPQAVAFIEAVMESGF